MSEELHRVSYDIGHPMTFEEMEEFKRLEAEHGNKLDPGPTPTTQKHPRLCEDEPVGTRRVALLSILAPT
jgi:hypothetical protein